MVKIDLHMKGAQMHVRECDIHTRSPGSAKCGKGSCFFDTSDSHPLAATAEPARGLIQPLHTLRSEGGRSWIGLLTCPSLQPFNRFVIWDGQCPDCQTRFWKRDVSRCDETPLTLGISQNSDHKHCTCLMTQLLSSPCFENYRKES